MFESSLMTQVYRFTASWCQPCKALAALLERDNIQILEVLDVDSEKAKPFIEHYGIRSVPTITIDRGNNDFTNIVGSTLSNHHKQLLKEALM